MPASSRGSYEEGRTVTERHYTDLTLLDLWGEIEKLLGIPSGDEADEQLRATGTVSSVENVAPIVAVEVGRRRSDLPSRVRKRGSGSGVIRAAAIRENPAKTALTTTSRHYRRRDSNLRHPAPQALDHAQESAVMTSETGMTPGCSTYGSSDNWPDLAFRELAELFATLSDSDRHRLIGYASSLAETGRA